MNTKLSTIEIQPTTEHKYSVIWLHGLGADGHDFEGIVPELDLTDTSAIHFVFPNAPVQPVTINGGMKMRAWYDILEVSLVRKVDVSGIYASAELLEELIQQEIDKGIPSENIVLAGFSQGGVIALHVGLRYKHRLAGILALSTYLPTVEQLKAEQAEVNISIPVLMAHGIQDPVVAIQSGKAACKELQAMGYPVQWQEYEMEHSVSLEEIKQISVFLNSVFI
jgi:phospholipase/carboxylesterase